MVGLSSDARQYKYIGLPRGGPVKLVVKSHQLFVLLLEGEKRVPKPAVFVFYLRIVEP